MGNNSLLSDFDIIEESINHREIVMQFIKDNYKIKGRLIISKGPNESGKYEVSCDYVEFKNRDYTSLTNGMFEWEKVRSNFSCRDCSLTSLEGAPKEVGGYFDCINCPSLKSLKGAPETVGTNFYCSYCISLTSLEGAPKKVGGNFHCYNCNSLRFESINDLDYGHKIFGDSIFLRGRSWRPYDLF